MPAHIVWPLAGAGVSIIGILPTRWVSHPAIVMSKPAAGCAPAWHAGVAQKFFVMIVGTSHAADPPVPPPPLPAVPPPPLPLPQPTAIAALEMLMATSRLRK